MCVGAHEAEDCGASCFFFEIKGLPDLTASLA